MAADAEQIDVDALAELSPGAFRQFVLRCAKRLCWEILSDYAPDEREHALKAIPGDMERAYQRGDASFYAAVSQLGALANAIRLDGMGWDVNGILLCCSDGLSAASAALLTLRFEEGLKLLTAIYRLARLPKLRDRDRPDDPTLRHVIRRDYEIARAAKVAPGELIDFGPLWLPGELPGDEDDWNDSWREWKTV
jgi:hypothetical protein